MLRGQLLQFVHERLVGLTCSQASEEKPPMLRNRHIRANTADIRRRVFDATTELRSLIIEINSSLTTSGTIPE